MRALFLPLVVLALANAAFAAGPPVRFDRSGDTVRVLVDEKPVATYHMGDQDIPRHRLGGLAFVLGQLLPLGLRHRDLSVACASVEQWQAPDQGSRIPAAAAHVT